MKYIKELQNFLDSELWDYSMKYDIQLNEEYEEEEYYAVKIIDSKDKVIWMVDFRLSKKWIDVDLYEDNWEEVCDFEYTVKYFWIALLMR